MPSVSEPATGVEPAGAVRVGGQAVPYRLRRSTRARRAAVHIHPRRGLEVVLPVGVAAREAKAVLAEQQDEEGNMHIHDFERTRYSLLVRAAQEAPLGELTGPVEVKGGYSVFKVVSKKAGSQSFAQVKKRVEATVKWLRKQVIFEQYLAELRGKYAAQVTIRENQLELAVGAD